jgi:catechol 2,3-dioxygenase-like lactoylglutathione lyase family enzyme
MPRVTGVLETCLYVANVERSARFYERLFGFRRMLCNERLCALAVAERGVLILFLQGATTKPVSLPGGILPAHDGSGRSHFAFAIPAEDLAAWEKRLTETGVAIESRVHWESGGDSLYFRDPDGHLAELATPGTWPIY